jgi:TonB family protein
VNLRKIVVVAACAALVPLACEREALPIQQPVAMPGESPFEYPVSLWDQGVEGETLLMVRVDEVGNVDSTYIERSSGHAEFDSAAIRGARELRFSPARRGERPVALWTRLPVRFERDSGVNARDPEPAPTGGS